MIKENLTEDNYLLECAKHYRNKQCQNTEEFLTDLRHVKYIKKLITRYTTKKTLDERLVLNHIIILNNVFGPSFVSRLLFLKLESQFEYIKPFLLYLKLLPDIIYGVNGKDIETLHIKMDWNIVNILRNIDRQSKN